MDQHCYIIMYDLRVPGRNYTELIDAIKQYPQWGHLTESSWAVITDKTPVEIRENLKRYLDTNDRLIVVQSGRNAAWFKCLASNSWIHENIIK